MHLLISTRDADEMSDLSDDMSLEGMDDPDSGHQEASVEVATEKETEASTPVVEPVMMPVSTEAEEIDPKFVVRPTDVTCVEGEPVIFECEVTGTEPVGECFMIAIWWWVYLVFIKKN